MTHPPASSAPLLAAAALVAAVLLSLHGRVLRYPFISDDYVFLYEVRHASPVALFDARGVTRNYYRPLGREVYFRAVSAVAGESPRAFHVLGFVFLLGVVGAVTALGWKLGGPRTGVLAGSAYALLYPHRVLLAWASCAQDLLAALAGT